MTALSRSVTHRWVAALAAMGVLAGGCITITIADEPIATPAPPTQVASLPTAVPPTQQSQTFPAATGVPPTVPPSVPPTAGPTDTPTEGPTATPAPTPTPTPTPTPAATSSAPPTGGAACEDDAYTLNGDRWDEPYRWYFNEDSTPERYDPDEVVELIIESFENITDVRNDCGLPDNVDATAIYAGPTSDPPCPDTSFEDVNIIGFVDLPRRDEELLAYVCTYGDSPSSRADIVISTDVAWALTTEECERDEELLEATMTHEAGHIFGLGHVGERRHGDLTMSTLSNGPCEPEEITLGLGDVLGLEEIYASE